ncbi:DNA-binding transcriptional ArsR family regulator [Arthrobacter stackebrandtii]|uniref:DNA-binding transcriptional ArsR family regulator n=1 Tax=Arthrobacter stackebrandtii TaxID=272161 RepID=A0ABS4YZK1_9MICC|nr:helix-turn-helix domain-containing protein [Arthrobacter stackebrandtii]MBP2414000.1 DNA-binding transcriptional ArsR family regulator [Arthrobacter stackebrandtii]
MATETPGTPAGERPARKRAQPRTMTSPMLKAMASPLRRRIVSVLAAQDYARATDLAQQLDVPANKLSYHLRILADAGMVREAPQFARDNRDRVWQAANEVYRLGSPEDPTPDREALSLGAYLSQMELDQHAALSRVLAWVPDYATGRDAEPKAELAIGTLRLTPAEAKDLFQDIERVVEAARKLHREPGEPGVKTWDYTFMAVREDL